MHDDESTPDPTVSEPLTITDGRIRVDIAPALGGRVAAITVDDVDLLVGRDTAPDTSGPLAWGSYPMVPWAGRIRNGRFSFGGRPHELPINFGDHAIHGVGFTSAWRVVRADERVVELELDLPTDERWPFGGFSRQRIEIDDGGLLQRLSVIAHEVAFPVSLGWHPWFRKPDRLGFHPTAMYRRDHTGIAVDELVAVPAPPWDDCFVNDRPVEVAIDGVEFTLESDCTRWVVYDEPPHATCVEPQTGPPDAFNIEPRIVRPGDAVGAWYRLRI